MITIEQFKALIDKHIIEYAGKAYYFGNLDLAKRKDIKELPDNFTVYGYLDITNSGIKEFPKGLEVMSELIASETKITELPKDKLRYNDLDISYTQISELKDNMVVNLLGFIEEVTETGSSINNAHFESGNYFLLDERDKAEESAKEIKATFNKRFKHGEERRLFG